MKYLSFLAEGEKLFNAAVYQCDFEMARVIARIGSSQMNPTDYLPTLAKFEEAGVKFESKSVSSDYQRFVVMMHLKLYEEALQYGIKVLAYATGNDAKVVTELGLGDMLLQLISAHDLYKQAFLLLKAAMKQRSVLDTPTTSLSDKTTEGGTHKLLSALHSSYAAGCVSSGQYNQAIYAYLLSVPPEVDKAVTSSRMMGDWSLALTIASVFDISDESASVTEASRASRVAREIVETYLAGIEQAQSCVEDMFTARSQDHSKEQDIGSDSLLKPASMIQSFDNLSRLEADRPSHAAQLCIQYCQDVEGAIQILVAAHRWQEAILTCCQQRRRDLLLEVIS